MDTLFLSPANQSLVVAAAVISLVLVVGLLERVKGSKF